MRCMVRRKGSALVLRFRDISISDVPVVGGKNASLGEMFCSLVKHGVKVPDGFAVTAHAYFRFIGEAGIKRDVKAILKGLDVADYAALSDAGRRIRALILKAGFSSELKDEILAHYRSLSREYGVVNADVAVRSSATAEDLPGASFAG